MIIILVDIELDIPHKWFAYINLNSILSFSIDECPLLFLVHSFESAHARPR